jgi:hypothetical protein
MGRNKKYFTDDEIKQFNRDKSMRYYLRNRDIIREKNKNRYHEKKNNKE